MKNSLYVENKKNNAQKRMSSLIYKTMWIGIISGIIQMLILNIFLKSIGFGWQYIVFCIILGIGEGGLVYRLMERNEEKIESVLRPMLWDMQVLIDQNNRYEEIVGTEDYELVGEKKHDKRKNSRVVEIGTHKRVASPTTKHRNNEPR